MPPSSGFYTEIAAELAKVPAESPISQEFRKHVEDNLLVLFNLRIMKLLSGAPEDNATKDERMVYVRYEDLVSSLNRFVDSVRSSSAKPLPRRVLVSFNSSLDAFVDSVMSLLGPFKKGDMAYIPEEDALVMSRYNLIEMLSKVNYT
ncbi:MAG: hypothetical protein M1357_02320 [Candidatus Marsarchaeota archaeon]|nr:hypothetical protein [Candidatus Marsarchaeota archaeon]